MNFVAEIGQALRLEPRPLLDGVSKLIVVYSAKSACTNVIAWFWQRIGHGEAAREFANPRHYRRVYCRSEQYRTALYDDLTSYVVVRVVRDPIERAASSFRHAIGTGYADDDLQRVLGRTSAEGLSFREFIDYLERVDLATANIHHRCQWHPIEGFLPVGHLINITRQDLFARLNDVERAEGWPVTDFAGIPWFSEAERQRQERAFARVPDAYEKRLSKADRKEGRWPHKADLLTPVARQRLAPLYASDVARYATP